MASLTLSLHAEDSSGFSAKVLSFDNGRSWITLELGGSVSVHLPGTDRECLSAARALIDVLMEAAAELETSIANRLSAPRPLPECDYHDI